MNEACGNCRFWKDRGQFEDADRGSCCRRSPSGGAHTSGNITYMTTWPTTLAGEWCGEFEWTAEIQENLRKSREEALSRDLKTLDGYKPGDYIHVGY